MLRAYPEFEELVANTRRQGIIQCIFVPALALRCRQDVLHIKWLPDKDIHLSKQADHKSHEASRRAAECQQECTIGGLL